MGLDGKGKESKWQSQQLQPPSAPWCFIGYGFSGCRNHHERHGFAMVSKSRCCKATNATGINCLTNIQVQTWHSKTGMIEIIVGDLDFRCIKRRVMRTLLI